VIPPFRPPGNPPRHRRWLPLAILAGILGIYLFGLGLQIAIHDRSPIDGVLVLGGSIQRERYVIAHAAQLPRPILISGGSAPDCVQRIVEDSLDRYPDRAPILNLDSIWLEPCATSTFENFAFAVPFLKAHGVQHVLVITSANHLFRAGHLGRVMLGFRGIAVDLFSVSERGRPGNHESALKTGLDLLRGTLWGLFSPLLPDKVCPGVVAVTAAKPPPVPSRCERYGLK
jgi:hypothetical protein